MVGVASLELCRELYELSGWADTHRCYRLMSSGDGKEWRSIDILPNVVGDLPAYDLGYLLRKLPTYVTLYGDLGTDFESRVWRCAVSLGPDSAYRHSADTPEDAACKLAIELFKQGVLTRGGDDAA